MGPAAAYALAAVAVLLLLAAAAYGWYHFALDWKKGSFEGGQHVNFSAGGRGASKLRFRKCTFSTQNPGGEKASWDVAPVLNGMAGAYAAGVPPGKEPRALHLGGANNAVPLNPFTFIKGGFNDPATVPADKPPTERWPSVPDAATKLVCEYAVLP